MSKEYTIGIDIGTSSIKIIVAEPTSGNEPPKILSNIEYPTQGFRNGYVNDLEHVTQSLGKALRKTESIIHGKVKRASFSIGGVGLSSQYVKTSLDIDNKSGEVSDRDVGELIRKSEELFTQKYPNKKILHIIPIKFSVNSRDVLGTPVGMYGNHLEVKIIFITILEHHYEAYISAIEKNNIEIKDEIIASPIADAAISLSYKQKIQGALLLNIGSETTSLATFENGNITSLEVFPIGSSDISNDLALGLQVDLEVAEDIKLQKNKEYPKRKVDEIIDARIADILEIAEKHLIKIKKNRMLPAGIIFSGAGSRVEGIQNHAKNILKLPASSVEILKQSKKTKRNTDIGPTFAVAYGLLLVDMRPHQSKKSFSLKHLKKNIRYWFDQLNP